MKTALAYASSLSEGKQLKYTSKRNFIYRKALRTCMSPSVIVSSNVFFVTFLLMISLEEHSAIYNKIGSDIGFVFFVFLISAPHH